MGNLVGGVYLYGQILTCIDKLDEQRELIAEALVVGLAHELFLQFGNGFVEAFSFQRTFFHDRLIILHSRDFPAFSHVLQLRVEVLERHNLVAAPKRLFEQGFKFDRLHIII